MNSKRNLYCLFGCAEFGACMHRFPHPERRSEEFLKWMAIARSKLHYTDPLRVYKNKRVCDFHFRPEDKTACHRLKISTVPCLHLNDPGSKSSQETIKKMKYLKRSHQKLKNRLKKSLKIQKSFRTRLAGAEKAMAGKAFHNITKNMTTAGRIFTGMQYRQALKKSKGRRYKFEEKVLSLSLYKKSPKCYSMLANYFTLPSAKTLRNLLGQIKLGPGTNKIIFEKMKETVSELNEQDKLCTLMFDKMSISPKIHYMEASDQFKGFVSHSENLNIATHALVFMIKGIKMSYKQPVAYYFTENINKIELKNIIVEVIRNVQATGLKIISTVCDQGSANAGAIKSLVEDEKRKYFRRGLELRQEMFEVDGQIIVPIFDVPHLIKGLRNNLLTKNLIYTDFEDGNKSKIIKWEYFQILYEADKSYKELR